jgi:hypothetical protein
MARNVRAAFLLSYLAKHTRRAYASDLEHWFAFCGAMTVDPLAASRAHVDTFAFAGTATSASRRRVRQTAALSSREPLEVENSGPLLRPFRYVSIDSEVLGARGMDMIANR